MWTIFHAAGATNVVWVWCPNAVDQPAGLAPHWTAYYPGDHYVDWVAADGYNHGGTADRTPLSLFMGIYNDYHTKKPIMIAETAALEPNKTHWITSLRQTLKHLPDIAAVIWFDQNNAARGWDWRITTTPSSTHRLQNLGNRPLLHRALITHAGSGRLDPEAVAAAWRSVWDTALQHPNAAETALSDGYGGEKERVWRLR